MNFEDLQKTFRNCFLEDQFVFSSGKNYIWAALKGCTPDNAVHYELIQRGEACFVELHVESNDYRKLVDRLHLEMSSPDNRRHFTFYSRYSQKVWQSRLPAFDPEHVEDDVADLRAAVDPVICSSLTDLNLPKERSGKLVLYGSCATCSPRQVAEYLASGNLRLPDVQRGKVWNVARIGTLWDSLLRGFPVGSFSIQDHSGTWDLLDGQQRSNAICLGFQQYPSNDRKKPILWLECAPNDQNKGGEKKFLFYVTTCSQPWGYRLSDDEMRNFTLTADEKRRASEGIQGHLDNAEKPYPDELYPYFSQMPVPVPLLTEWIKVAQEKKWDSFKTWCLTVKHGQDWPWLKRISNRQPDQWDDIVKAFEGLEKYEIVLTNASNVVPEDVALYFTRIGRGGVMPSDEELAYSVLKSKIGGDFRAAIEKITQNGMASAARIAHLAIRCYSSRGKDFYSGSILEQANKIAEKESEAFSKFVGGFSDLVESVNKVLDDAGFTRWHRSRYCTYAGGDIYLFLLLTARDCQNDLSAAIGIAEYVSCFANHPQRVLRLMRLSGLADGFARSLRESYYGMPYLEFPVEPSQFSNLTSMDHLKETWNSRQNHALVNLLKKGYGNSKMYGILLYACGKYINTKINYDPYLAEWADESRPWDYDHILPRSWFGSIGGNDESFFCQELANSLGNLAPLPFSLNRAISDKERNEFYPCTQDEVDCREIQAELHIKGANIVNRNFEKTEGAAERIKFCLSTVSRFAEIYQCWFTATGVSQILADSAFTKRRQELFRVLEEKIKISDADDVVYYTDGAYQYPVRNEFDWARPWLAVGKCTEKDFVSAASDGKNIEVGLRRLPEKTDIDGKNIWYRDNMCDTTFSFEKPNLAAELEEKLLSLLSGDQK